MDSAKLPNSCRRRFWFCSGLIAHARILYNGPLGRRHSYKAQREKISLYTMKGGNVWPHWVIRDLCLAGLLLLPIAKLHWTVVCFHLKLIETQNESQSEIQRQSWKLSELDLYLCQKSCILPGTVQLWFQRAMSDGQVDRISLLTGLLSVLQKYLICKRLL